MGEGLRRSIAAASLTALVVALGSATTLPLSACVGDECKGSTMAWGCAPGELDATGADGGLTCCRQGVMLDENHWATTLPNAGWLDFPAFRVWELYPGGWTGSRVPYAFYPYSAINISPGAQQGGVDAPIASDDPPDAPNSNWTEAPGNLGEFIYQCPGYPGPTSQSCKEQNGRVQVENATCSGTVALVVIGFLPVDHITEDMKGPCWKAAEAAGTLPWQTAGSGDGGTADSAGQDAAQGDAAPRDARGQ